MVMTRMRRRQALKETSSVGIDPSSVDADFEKLNQLFQ
jgi:hypothetical protein